MSITQCAADLCAKARSEGRDTLLEPELYSLLAEGGVPVPANFMVTPDAMAVAAIAGTPRLRFQGCRKVVSPAITHKTEMGGVRFVENTPGHISACTGIIQADRARRAGAAATVRGLMVSRWFRSVTTFLPSSLQGCGSHRTSALFSHSDSAAWRQRNSPRVFATARASS